MYVMCYVCVFVSVLVYNETVNTNMVLCMLVSGLCEASCAFAYVWKWHMLAVGGSAWTASRLTGG